MTQDQKLMKKRISEKLEEARIINKMLADELDYQLAERPTELLRANTTEAFKNLMLIQEAIAGNKLLK